MKYAAAFFMLIPISCGLVVDGITSAVGIGAILQARNPIAWTVAIAGGIMITGFSMITKYVWARQRKHSIWLFRLMWMIAVSIDVYTTVIGTVHFVILRKWFDSPVATTIEALAGNLGNDPAHIAVTVGITVLVAMSPVCLPFVFENLEPESQATK